MSAAVVTAPTTKTKRRMYPFEAFYGTRPHGVLNSSAIERGLLDHRTGKFHARSSYSDIELASLARWLNDRATGYADTDGMS